MSKATQQTTAKRLITRFDKACQAYAWKGSQMPEMHPIIEKEYKASREALEKFLFVILMEAPISQVVSHDQTLAGRLGYPEGSVTTALDTITKTVVGVGGPVCPKCHVRPALIATEACGENEHGEIFEAMCSEHGEFKWQEQEPS